MESIDHTHISRQATLELQRYHSPFAAVCCARCWRCLKVPRLMGGVAEFRLSLVVLMILTVFSNQKIGSKDVLVC